jgi:hypothetical protein
MKILRRRIQKRTILNSLGFQTEAGILFDRDEPMATIAYGYQNSSDNLFEGSNNEIAGVREIGVTLGTETDGLRFFTGIDRSMIDVTDGFYQYGVEVEIEDGTKKYINEIYSNLAASLIDLKKYYDMGTRLGMTKYIMEVQDPHIDSADETYAIFNNSTGNYEPISNRFTQKFIDEQRGLYLSSESEAPWVLPIMYYVQALTLLTPMGGFFDFVSRAISLVKFTAPETGNPRSVLAVIQTIEKFLRRLEKLTTPSGGIRSRDSLINPTDVGSKTSGTAVETRKYMHWFIDKTFDSNQLKDYGMDYLSQFEVDNYDKEAANEKLLNEPSLRVVGGEEYLQRVQKETLKFFNSTEPSLDLQVGNKFVSSEDSIDNSSFGFLSPSFCYLGGETKRFLDVNNNNPKDKVQSYDYYTLATAAIANYNVRKGRVSFTPRKQRNISKPAQKLRSELTSYFSNFGVSIQSSLERTPVTGTDKQVSARKVSFIGTKERLQANIQEDRKIDPLEPEKVEGGTNSESNTLREINPNITLLSMGNRIMATGYGNENLSPGERTLSYNKTTEVDGYTFKTDSIQFMNVRSDNNIIDYLSSPRKAKKVARLLGLGMDENLPPSRLLKFMPNQLKSIMLSGVSNGSAKNLLGDNGIGLNPDKEGVSFDPITDPQKAPFYQINFALINKIEVLVGYSNNAMRVKEPIWEVLTREKWNNSVGSFLICRIKGLKLPFLGIGKYKGLEFPKYDEHFLLRPFRTAPELTSPSGLQPGQQLEEAPPLPPTNLRPGAQSQSPGSLPFTRRSGAQNRSSTKNKIIRLDQGIKSSKTPGYLKSTILNKVLIT